MRKNLLLLLLMLSAVTAAQAQIINKNNSKRISQNIKRGFNEAIDAISQDAHPTGEHDIWSGYIAPRLGVSVSSMPGAGGRPEPGILGGAYIETFVASSLGISIELTYSHLGANNVHYTYMRNTHDEEGNVTGQEAVPGRYNYDLGYINTLYLVHWYPWSYKPLSFYTGIQMSRLVSAKSHMKGSTTSDIKNRLHKGEFQIPVGVSYEFGQWEVDARYFISPRKLAHSPRAKRVLGNARNMSLALSVAYKIQIF